MSATSVRLHKADLKWHVTPQSNLVHQCTPGRTSRNLGASFIANRMRNALDADPVMAPRTVNGHMQVQNLPIPSYHTARRSILRLSRVVNGKPEHSYAHGKLYLEALQASNPGTFLKWEQTEQKRFQRVFLFPSSQQNMIRHGCGVIALDGTHLKNQVSGILLLAVTRDAVNAAVILAFAIVSSENEDNWAWFCRNLKDGLDEAHGSGTGITFVSDRDKGLIPAVSSVFPDAQHCFCVWHIVRNITAKYRGTPVAATNLVYTASKALTEDRYEAATQQLSTRYPDVWRYLSAIDVTQWTTFHCPSTRFGETTSNICESMNNVLLPIRKQPFYPLIRKLCAYISGKTFDSSKKAAEEQMAITSYAQNVLSDHMRNARGNPVVQCGDGCASVSAGPTQYSVNLSTKICSCNYWKEFGIPCVHACGLYTHLAIDPITGMHERYTTEAYRNSYSQHLLLPAYSINTADNWLEIPVLEPIRRRQKGRPRTVRKRSRSEPTGNSRPRRYGLRSRK